jgi:hypothetical protein
VASEVWHSRSNAKRQAACNPRVLARGLDRIVTVRCARLARLTGHASVMKREEGSPACATAARTSRHGGEAAAPPILLRTSVLRLAVRGLSGLLITRHISRLFKSRDGTNEGTWRSRGRGEEFPRRHDVRPLSRRKHNDIVGVAKGGKRGTPGVLWSFWVQRPGKKDCRPGPVLMRGRGVSDDVAGNGINHRCQGRGSAGGSGPIWHLVALV